MEHMTIHTYPHGIANSLGQDAFVQRLNDLNKFDDCLVIDLEEGDKYFAYKPKLPKRTAQQILDFIQKKNLDIFFIRNVDGDCKQIGVYSAESHIDTDVRTSSLEDAINYIMDMDTVEL